MRRKKIEKKIAVLMEQRGVQYIKAKFPFSVELIAKVKSIPGREWNAKKRYWTLPLKFENAVALKNWGFNFGFTLTEWARMEQQVYANPTKIQNIPGLLGTPYPYQYEGVSYVEDKRGRALIGDEMGLGKTLQALAWLQYRPDVRPALIITTASMKHTWESEIHKFMTGVTPQVLSGTNMNEELTGDILIINYDILVYWYKRLALYGLKCVVMDEIHYIKNDKAARTKNCKKICKGVPHVIGLSGTPLENGTIEIYNPVNIINPNLFPSKYKFKHRYCAPKHNGFGWDFSGASNVDELHKILTKHVMIRRKKKDVLDFLPDKTYNYVPLTIENRREYLKAENDFIEYVMDKAEKEVRNQVAALDMDAITVDEQALDDLKETVAEAATPLAQIELLKQLAVKGKMNSVFQWVDDFLQSGEKLVVFCEHKFVIDELMKRYKKQAVKIDGSVPVKRRKQIVDDFQKKKGVRLFVGNKAAQEGLTLTASSNVAHIEYPWTPGALAQRTDRVHRISQKNAVGVYYLIAEETIEHKIVRALDEKQKVAEQVLDGQVMSKGNLITDLINNYRKHG